MGVKTKISLDRSNRLIKGLSKANVSAIIDNGLNHGYELMRQRVHVVTGELESSLDYEVNVYKGRLIAGAEHAIYEIARGGHHDFMTDAVNAATELIIAELQGLVKD
jgi:hypothetical protein